MFNKLNTYLAFASLLLLSTFGPQTVMAQDPHFSQFYSAPLLINPALAGSHNGTYRLTSMYRDQWRSALDNPLTTFTFAGDLKFDVNLKKTGNPDIAALGFNFFSDRVGGFDLNSTSMAVTAAYHKLLNAKKKQYLGIGIQLGVLQKSVNYEDLTFQDQFNTVDGYSFNTSEVLPSNNYAVADLSIGLNYSVQPDKNLRYNVGVAMYHFTQPNISFYGSSEDPNPALQKENKLFSKLVFNASADIRLSELVSISPRLLYLKQDVHTEVDLGNNFRIEFVERDYMAVHFGAWIRVVDNLSGISPESIITMAGLEYKQFIFGFSYDLGIGDVFDSRLGLTSYEFSVTYTGQHDNDTAFCPKF